MMSTFTSSMAKLFAILYIFWRLEQADNNRQFLINIEYHRVFLFIQNEFQEFSLIFGQINIFQMWKQSVLVAVLLVVLSAHSCVHDQFSQEAPKHFLNDLTDRRLLAPAVEGRIRIFVDYTQITVGSLTEINTIKRATNITATYFYNILNVTRLPRLYYPANTPLQCNTLTIPQHYVTEGAIGDIGVVCGNENNPQAVYVAKSVPCAFLESNKRPIWGMMSWNNAFLAYDQAGFQELLFTGIHEMTHILGFTALMYELYPNGNPLVVDDLGFYYLNSSSIQRQIKAHYGCSSSKGLPLEDQDGTLISSHWERKVVGNDYMIASSKKGAFLSRFTLALFESSGWYPYVNYYYAQPTTWGRNKGCSFLNIDDCGGEQFCQDSSFSCDADATGIGKCGLDAYTGACKTIKYYTNTICVDQNFQLKNLNSNLNALERGGSTSKCFSSDFRQEGTTATKLNNRCYISVCSVTGKFIYILVGSYVMICKQEGQVLPSPPGLTGTLTCPKSFAQYCENKKTCPYHCNKNGACINGKCLCTGSTEESPSCIDVSIFLAPIGSTGGLLNSNTDNTQDLGPDLSQVSGSYTQRRTLKEFSINRKCIQGTTYDRIFGECLECTAVFGCQDCTDAGCISCDNGDAPVNNRCGPSRR